MAVPADTHKKLDIAVSTDKAITELFLDYIIADKKPDAVDEYLIDNIKYNNELTCQWKCCTSYTALDGKIHGKVHDIKDQAHHFVIYNHGEREFEIDIIGIEQLAKVYRGNTREAVRKYYRNGKMIRYIAYDAQVRFSKCVIIYNDAGEMRCTYNNDYDCSTLVIDNFDITAIDDINKFINLFSKVNIKLNGDKYRLTAKSKNGLIDEIKHNEIYDYVMKINPPIYFK